MPGSSARTTSGLSFAGALVRCTSSHAQRPAALGWAGPACPPVSRMRGSKPPESPKARAGRGTSKTRPTTPTRAATSHETGEDARHGAPLLDAIGASNRLHCRAADGPEPRVPPAVADGVDPAGQTRASPDAKTAARLRNLVEHRGRRIRSTAVPSSSTGWRRSTPSRSAGCRCSRWASATARSSFTPAPTGRASFGQVSTFGDTLAQTERNLSHLPQGMVELLPGVTSYDRAARRARLRLLHRRPAPPRRPSAAGFEAVLHGAHAPRRRGSTPGCTPPRATASSSTWSTRSARWRAAFRGGSPSTASRCLSRCRSTPTPRRCARCRRIPAADRWGGSSTPSPWPTTAAGSRGAAFPFFHARRLRSAE